ncbi:MAG: hypothetical protein ACI3YL_00120 [Prevotella sp.]
MVAPEVVLLYLAVNPDNSCYHYVIDISHVISSSVDLDKTQRPYEARNFIKDLKSQNEI